MQSAVEHVPAVPELDMELYESNPLYRVGSEEGDRRGIRSFVASWLGRQRAGLVWSGLGPGSLAGLGVRHRHRHGQGETG